MEFFRWLNPRHTLWTFVPLWIALALLGGQFTNLNAFLVSGIAFVLALPINKMVADMILHRNMTKK